MYLKQEEKEDDMVIIVLYTLPCYTQHIYTDLTIFLTATWVENDAVLFERKVYTIVSYFATVKYLFITYNKSKVRQTNNILLPIFLNKWN